MLTIAADNPIVREGMRAPAPQTSGEERIGGRSMSLNLQIVHDPSGTWSLHGLPGRPVAHHFSLAASIDYARRQCASAPATIELIVNGSYAVIYQEGGWRRPVAEHHPPPAVSLEPEDQPPPAHSKMRAWLQKWGRGK